MTSEVLSTAEPLYADALGARKDGGPAFPHTINGGNGFCEVYFGMSMRDYFAAQALVANKGWIVGTADDAARDAYTIADAMLKAREDKNV